MYAHTRSQLGQTVCALTFTAVNLAYDKYFKRTSIPRATLNDLGNILGLFFFVFYFVLVAKVTSHQLFSLIGHAKFA